MLRAGSGTDWHAGLSVVPLRGLAGPVWDCCPVLLRSHHFPLRTPQCIITVESHDCQRFSNAELCVRGGHLHLCRHGYSGPCQMAG